MIGRWREHVAHHGAAVLVLGLGITLSVATLHAAGTGTTAAVRIDAALLGVVATAIIARAITLFTTNRPPKDRWRIAAWCGTGVLTASMLAGLVLFRTAVRGTALADPVVLIELFAGVGAIAGLFVGGDQVRSIEAGRTSEREQTSELLEKREEERLAFLNHLLRHNVLNGMNIVLGYAATLDGRVSDDEAEYVDRIRTRSQAVVELVQNVQVLVRSLSGDLTVDAVDLTETARDQVSRARTNHDATFHADLTPGVTVATTPYVSAVIENLLTNAVVHNDADDPTVAVSVDRHADTGTITITDDGPGIPQDVVDTYFGDRPIDPDDAFVADGLGLYLVDELVTTHGGTISVERRDPRGTTITLEFPLTADEPTVEDAGDTAVHA